MKCTILFIDGRLQGHPYFTHKFYSERTQYWWGSPLGSLPHLLLPQSWQPQDQHTPVWFLCLVLGRELNGLQKGAALGSDDCVRAGGPTLEEEMWSLWKLRHKDWFCMVMSGWSLFCRILFWERINSCFQILAVALLYPAFVILLYPGN